MRQEIENHQRFSLRKVKAYKKAGLASVFLGTSLLMANLGNVVHADSTDSGSATGTNAVIENESNTVPAGAAQDQAQAKSNDQATKTQVAQTVTSQKADDAKMTEAAQNAGQASMNQAAKADQVVNKANDSVEKGENTQAFSTQQGSTNTLDVAQAGKTNANVTNKEVKASGVGVDDGNMPDSGVRQISGSNTPITHITWPSNIPTEADASYTRNIVFNYKYGDNNTVNLKGEGQESAKELGYSVIANKAGQDYRPSQSFKVNVGYHYKYDANTGSIHFSNFHVDQDADWNNLVNAVGKDNIQIYPAAGKTDPLVNDQNMLVAAITNNVYNKNDELANVATVITQFDNAYPTAYQPKPVAVYDVMADKVNNLNGILLAPSKEFNENVQVNKDTAVNIYNEPRTTSITYYVYARPYYTTYHFLDSTGKEVAEDGDNAPHYVAEGNYASTYNNSRLQTLKGMKNYVLNDLQNGQKVANDSVAITSTWDSSINKFKNTANNLAFNVAAQGGHEDALTFDEDGSAYNNIYLTVTDKTSELRPDGKGGISGDTTGITEDKKSAIEKAMYETINQKITANVPNSAPQDLSRHTTLERNVTYNYQTGAITAPDWSTVSGQLPAVVVPKATGYVAAPNTIDATNITGNQVDSQGQYTGGAITINYTPSAEAHYKVYSFVDDQNGDQEIPSGRIVITGQVGKAINPADQGLKVPDKYSLANGNAIPTSITMTMADPMDASQAKPTVIHLVHATKPRTTTKSFTRSIYETAPGSANKQLLKEQTVTFTSTVNVDQVTGTASPDNWQPQGTATWAALGIGGVANHKTLIDGKEGNSIPAVTLDPKTAKDVEVDVTFAPIPVQSVITFTDRVNDGTQAKTGTITTKTLNGNKGNSQNFDFGWVPDGYVEDGAAPTKIELGQNYTVYIKDGIVTVKYTDPQKKGSRVPGVNGSTFPSGVDKDDLNKDAQRVVSVKTPDGKTQTITQTVPMHRDATVDPVNSKVSYTDWEPNKPNDEFPAINVGTGKDDIPSVSGYTPDITDNGKDLGSKGLPAEKPTDPTKPHDINVTYKQNKPDTPNTPVEGSRGIIFTDPTGNQVGKGTVKGTEGTDVPVKGNDGKVPGLPDGYVPSKDAPTTVHIPKPGEDNSPLTIPVEHGKAVVDHNHPKNPSDVIPGTDIHYPAGVSQDDLTGAQERIINITKPDGSRHSVDQKVPVYRDATVDEVTGEVTYTDWTPAKRGDKFDSIAIPAIKDGHKVYEPAVTVDGKNQVLPDDTYPAASVNPKGDNKPVVVDVQYVVTKDDTPTAVEGGRDVIFTDPTGKQIGKDTVKGTEGTYVPVKGNDGNVPGLPNGYVPSKNAPTTVYIPKPGEDNSPVTIPVEHGKAVVHHNQPKNPSDVIPGTDIHYPKGVAKDDLNGVQEHIINITKPDGTTQTVDQKVPVYRDATVDEVTGNVTYDDWTPVKPGDKFGAVSVPEITQNGKHYQGSIDIDGKEAILSDGQYPATNVDPKGDNKPQTISIKYVLTSTDAPDKPTQDTITVSHDYRDGQKDKNGDPYVIQKGEKLPGSDVVSDTTLTAKDLNKVITRTVTVALPDGTTKTMTQKTSAHRDALFDSKTGKFLKFTPWTSETDHFNAINLDPVKGYTAHVLDPNGKDLGTTIPETKIDPNDANGGNQTLTVKYTKDQAKDTSDGNNGYTGGGDTGAPSVPVDTDTNKTNESNDDHLQDEIDALKRQVNKLSNEVDKLAARRVGKGGRTPGNSTSGIGHTNKTGYGVNTGTGTGYAYNTDGSAGEVAPSGYINYGYSTQDGNGVAQAAAIDNTAQNGYGQELPQTGSESETGIIMAGIMSLAMATAAAIGATKRKKEE